MLDAYINGIGNIVGLSTFYDEVPPWWSSLSNITEDSIGINIPIFANTFPIVTKSAKLHNFFFNYLVFIHSVNDSNAFIRINDWGRKEFWTKNHIADIDVKLYQYAYSAWIEQTATDFALRYHIGYALPNIVEYNITMANLFSLEQNYPNPFNPSTIIRYCLQSSGYVKLSIFDILGRELKILVKETQSIGFHEVRLDASEFPSGLYFYRLTNDMESITKKMIFIR